MARTLTKLTQGQLNELGIHNDFNLTMSDLQDDEARRLVISYHPATRPYGAKWTLKKHGYKLPGAHFSDWGGKSWPARKKSDPEPLAEAMAWANERYAITCGWTKTPFGGYVRTDFYEARMNELIEQYKAGHPEVA